MLSSSASTGFVIELPGEASAIALHDKIILAYGSWRYHSACLIVNQT